VFSEDVTGFTAADVTLSSGTAVVTGGPSTYNVAVDGMADGALTASIPANVVTDSIGNSNTASTSADNSVIYDVTAPDTTIITSPSNPSADPDPMFSFGAEDGTGSGIASFQCQIDGGGFSACKSGSSFGVLGEGSHTFEVRATDNASNTDATPASYTWTIDVTGPIVTIDQDASQSDPTNTSPINFIVAFSETVTGFDNTDVVVSGTAGATSAMVTEISPNDGTTYSVSVSGMAGDGTVIADIPADAAFDSSSNGNIASVSADNTVTYNTGAPDTTIDSHPTNPSNSANASFTFSSPDEDGTGFECKLDNGNFDICISPIDYASLAAGSHAFQVRAIDDANNVDPSPASFTWSIDVSYPTVSSSAPATSGTIQTGSTQLTVTFSEDVKHDGSSGAADNKANYLLIEEGENNKFNTVSCANGLVPDDTLIAINNVTYTNHGGNGPFVATISVNSLTAGSYRLFVCGTTSIQDFVGNKLNNGTSDTIVSFYVHHTGKERNNKKENTNVSGMTIPVTGFAQGEITSLPIQPAEKAYSATELWLEIPRLGVKMSIVGVPQTAEGWDVSWLGKEAGWLNGSAYPTWGGNSVLTGHVWGALNQPGPFAQLKALRYGDQIKIHSSGQVYTYEVTENSLILPSSITTAFQHHETSVITLITCEDYKETSKTYLNRRMVRAVLVSVTAEQ
jgi:LPXTG-site transpeptidase (sortase) family protein